MSRRLLPFGFSLLILLASTSQGRTEDDDFADVRHTSSALQKLRADPLLKSLHLIVVVHKGVATLRGPVPTEELIRRAGLCVRQVPEIRDVRNECHLGHQANPLMLVEGPKSPPPEFVVNKDPSPAVWVPLSPDSLKFQVPKVKAIPREELRIVVTMLPPVQPRLPAVTPEPELMQPVSRPKHQFNGLDPLKRQLQSLTRQDVRYQGLRLEVREGVVSISGVVSTWADLHVLSRRLTKMPGVDRVVWMTVRADH